MMDMFGDLLTALDRRRKGMMAQNDPVRKDDSVAASSSAAAAASSQLASADDSIGAAGASESKLRLILPDNIDADSATDEEADAEWLAQ
jgi:hypothetical protein